MNFCIAEASDNNSTYNILARIMERAGSQRKLQPNVWRIGSPWCGSTNTPSKIGSAKRRLSLRSENTAITAETATPQSSSSLSRQATGLTQKQPGKENESPFVVQNSPAKVLCPIARSTTKRRKSSNPTNLYITDSERKVIRRRLSGDYGDQLSANKFYRATQVEPIVVTAKTVQQSETDGKTRFPVYNDGDTLSFVAVQEGVRACIKVQDAGALLLDKTLAFEEDSAEEKVKNDGWSTAQRSIDGKEFSNSRLLQEQGITDGQFRIERVDRGSSKTPITIVNSFRRIKSGSDICRRLNVPIRRGDDISPLKRRINQLKRSGMIIGRGYGVDKRGTAATTAAALIIGGVATAGDDHASNSIIESNRMKVGGKIAGSTLPCSDQTREGEYGLQRTIVEPSTGATKKIHRPYTCSSEAKQACSENISEISGSSACGMQTSSSEPNISDLRPPRDQGISGTEFRIERVDCISAGGTGAMNNMCKSKSGSGIERLGVPIGRAGDISSLKRRISQLKSSAVMIEGRSCGVNEKLDAGSVTAAGKVDASNSKTGLKSIGVIVEITKSMVRCPGGTRERKYTCQKSTEDPLTGANNIASCGEARQVTRNASKLSEIEFTTDYTRESIDLECAREEYCYKMSQTFLKGTIAITPEQRRIVVNFLISVHDYLSTSSSTLHQATKMFDAVLDIKDVSVKELQLVALGALWISMKNMETRIPSASEMISFAKDMYHAEGPGLLCKCERKILKTLGFRIRFPDPYYISAYNLHQWSSLGTVADEPSIREMIHCAGYLMDVALLDEHYSSMPVELLAAAATQAAANLVLSRSRENSMKNFASNNEKLFSRYTREEMDLVIGPLLGGVLDSAVKNSPIGAVYKKYKNCRYDNTSDHLVERIKKLGDPICEEEN